MVIISVLFTQYKILYSNYSQIKINNILITIINDFKTTIVVIQTNYNNHCCLLQ